MGEIGPVPAQPVATGGLGDLGEGSVAAVVVATVNQDGGAGAGEFGGQGLA
jgi:hypothetical protein